MNIYSALSDSDEENNTKPITTTKKVVKETTTLPTTGVVKSKATTTDKKSAKGENAAPSNAVSAPKTRDNGRAAKPAVTTNDAAVEDRDPDAAGKESNRGGKPRGKDTPKRGERKSVPSGGEEDGQRRPKREFDRRSGTGRGKELAKGGRGSYGAGNVNQDAQDAEKHPDAAAELLEPHGDATADDDAVAAAEEQQQPDPEPVTFTLDEYMEKRDAARREARQLLGAGDKPARTVDASVEFAGLVSVEGAEIDNYMAAKNLKTAEAARKDQRSTSKAKVLDVGFKFERASPYGDRPERGDRGERGGRGERSGRGDRSGDRGAGRGGRSGRGDRSGGRGDRNAPTTVFNSVDFPSL